MLPSHPDYEPIIQVIRTKYDLPEIYPLDDPIKEIYLGEEIITIEQFTQDVKQHILDSMDTLFPEDFVKKYRSSKTAFEGNYQKELDKFDGELKPVMEMFFEFTKNASMTVYKILDAHLDEIAIKLSNYLLFGDSIEAPQDWFGKVFTLKAGDETMILSMTSELTNLDYQFQQIRDLHKKTYGNKQIKITPTTANTAYYLQLKKRGKDSDFILDQFIRLNKISPPRNKKSPQCTKFRMKVAKRLNKRVKTASTILNVYSGEKK